MIIIAPTIIMDIYKKKLKKLYPHLTNEEFEEIIEPRIKFWE
jgi:hypothetical protein